jgi:mannosyltransferase
VRAAADAGVAAPGRADISTCRAGVLVLAIAVVALALRYREALRTPSWLDEIYVIWATRLGPDRMLHLLATQDMHPPLHFLLVWAWRALGGEGDLWLKSLSILVGLGTVLATFGMTREMFGRAAGCLAAALVALHPSALYFSQEIRSYGALWLLVTLATWLAWRWVEEKPGRNSVGFGLVVVAGLYTHYLFGVILAFLEIWVLARLLARPARLRAWLGLHLLIGLAFAPQLPVLLDQLRRNREHWIRPADLDQLFDLFRMIAFGAVKATIPVLLLALWPLCVRRDRPAALVLAAVTLPPVLITWYLTHRGAHLFTERYMVYTVPIFCALAAGGVFGLPWPRLRPWAAAALLLVAGVQVARTPPFAESASLGRACAWLAPRLQPGDQVFCADSHSLLFLRQHLAGRANYRLLLTDPKLPYYEMAMVIPPEWRVNADTLAATRARGGRWWGVRTRHGGFPTTGARELFVAAADSAALSDGLVAVWRGKEGR